MCSGGLNLYHKLIFAAPCFLLPYDWSQNRYSILRLAEACDTEQLVLSLNPDFLLMPNRGSLLIKHPTFHHILSLCLFMKSAVIFWGLSLLPVFFSLPKFAIRGPPGPRLLSHPQSLLNVFPMETVTPSRVHTCFWGKQVPLNILFAGLMTPSS